MALLAGGGSAQLVRDIGAPGSVDGFVAFDSALAGATLDSALPFSADLQAGDGVAQLKNRPPVTLQAPLVANDQTFFPLTATAVEVQKPQQPETQGGGAGGGGHYPSYLEKTSRNSDDRAYDSSRVAKRLEKVVINGKSYDPFDPRLIDILTETAKAPEPEFLSEAERHERRLSRTFAVTSQGRTVSVPLFRPMLAEMPQLSTALIEDFEAFAAKAKEEADRERRRILMLLTADCWA